MLSLSKHEISVLTSERNLLQANAENETAALGGEPARR